MTATLKKKLCWNCEGRVASHEEHCPYCGVYIDGTLDNNRDIEDDIEEDTSPHQPPYTPIVDKNQSNQETPNEVSPESSQLADLSIKGVKKEFLPLILLLIGTTFLLFSFVLLLFSHNGTLTLKWDASLWFVYLIIAVPTLALGWRFLSAIKDSE